VTRPDAHHAWLFACAGLEVEHRESGCVGGEVTAWVLVKKGECSTASARTPNEWRRPHRGGEGEDDLESEIVQPTLDVKAMEKAVEARTRAMAIPPCDNDATAIKSNSASDSEAQAGVGEASAAGDLSVAGGSSIMCSQH